MAESQNSCNISIVNSSILTESATPFTSKLGAGSFSGTGANVTAVGYQAAKSGTGMQQSTVVGSGALGVNTNANGATAVGYNALGSQTGAGSNTGIGESAGAGITSALFSTAIGANAMLTGPFAGVPGSYNVAVGYQAMLNATAGDNTCIGAVSMTGVTGRFNCSLGTEVFPMLTSGTNNVAVGFNAGPSLVTGSYDCLLGNTAGSGYTGAESSNICIMAAGTAGESNVIRVGTQGTGNGQQNLCYVAGITGSTPVTGNTPQVVLCDSTGKLAPISSSTSGFVLTSNGSATPSFQAPTGSGAVITSWVDQGTSITGVVGTGYFATAAITITLPAAPSQGNVIAFIVDTASTFVIQANTGQTIRLGSSTSSSAGTATNTQQGDGMTLVYRAADTTWLCWNSPTGAWTLA